MIVITLNTNPLSANNPVPEGAQFTFGPSGPHLRLLLVEPTPPELANVRHGAAEFALVRYESVLFFLAKFGDGEWMDAPFSIHIEPPERRALPSEFRPGLHYALYVDVIDPLRQRQHGSRVVTFSPAFSERLHCEVERQLAAPSGLADYCRDIGAAYARFPLSSSMLPAAVARTRGGSTGAGRITRESALPSHSDTLLQSHCQPSSR